MPSEKRKVVKYQHGNSGRARERSSTQEGGNGKEQGIYPALRLHDAMEVCWTGLFGDTVLWGQVYCWYSRLQNVGLKGVTWV